MGSGAQRKYGIALLSFLEGMIVSTSFSRPRTSNDNLFIKSFFKTLKYSGKHPLRFKNIEHARDWMADFVNWYNADHLHLSKWTELYENKLQKGDIFVDTKNLINYLFK